MIKVYFLDECVSRLFLKFPPVAGMRTCRVNSKEWNKSCNRVQARHLGLDFKWSLGGRGAQIKRLRIEIWLDEREKPRDASASPVDDWHHALLAVCVSCRGGSTHYETPWHGVTEGFRLCWPSWGHSPPSASWPSPSAPTTGFTPGRTSATPLMPPQTKPRCKPRKSKATWRTPDCGGSAVSKVKHSLISLCLLVHKPFICYIQWAHWHRCAFQWCASWSPACSWLWLGILRLGGDNMCSVIDVAMMLYFW